MAVRTPLRAKATHTPSVTHGPKTTLIERGRERERGRVCVRLSFPSFPLSVTGCHYLGQESGQNGWPVLHCLHQLISHTVWQSRLFSKLQWSRTNIKSDWGRHVVADWMARPLHLRRGRDCYIFIYCVSRHISTYMTTLYLGNSLVCLFIYFVMILLFNYTLSNLITYNYL